jgi:hypothetical protein
VGAVVLNKQRISKNEKAAQTAARLVKRGSLHGGKASKHYAYVL